MVVLMIVCCNAEPELMILTTRARGTAAEEVGECIAPEPTLRLESDLCPGRG